MKKGRGSIACLLISLNAHPVDPGEVCIVVGPDRSCVLSTRVQQTGRVMGWREYYVCSSNAACNATPIMQHTRRCALFPKLDCTALRATRERDAQMPHHTAIRPMQPGVVLCHLRKQPTYRRQRVHIYRGLLACVDTAISDLSSHAFSRLLRSP